MSISLEHLHCNWTILSFGAFVGWCTCLILLIPKPSLFSSPFSNPWNLLPIWGACSTILLFASFLILFWIFCFPVCLRALYVSHTDAVPYRSWSPLSLFNVICHVVDNIVVFMHACILVGKPKMMKIYYCVFMFVYICEWISRLVHSLFLALII